jgi:hypothetical protein
LEEVHPARSIKVEARDGREESSGIGVFCTEAALLLPFAGMPFASFHG